MAVKIRMRRMGNRNNPFYRIVVMDSRMRRDGRFIEIVGFYNPLRNPTEVSIKEDRALYWLKIGAKMSDTVKSLFKRTGILEKFTGIKYASSISEKPELSKKEKKKAAVKAAASVEEASAPAKEDSAPVNEENPKEEAPESTQEA